MKFLLWVKKWWAVIAGALAIIPLFLSGRKKVREVDADREFKKAIVREALRRAKEAEEKADGELEAERGLSSAEQLARVLERARRRRAREAKRDG